MLNLNYILKKYINTYAGLSKKCWQSIFLTFFQSITSGICFFLSLYFVNHLHISIQKSGLLISFFGLGTICGGLFGGKLSDFISPRKIAMISLFLESLSIFLLTELTNYIAICTNIFFIGLSLYAFITSNNLWLLQTCSNAEQKLKSLNITRAISNLGMGLSGVIIGIISLKYFQFVFYISSFITLCSSVYLKFFTYEEMAEHVNTINKLTISNHHLKNKKLMLLMLICMFLIGLIIAQLSVTYPLYIQDSFPLMGMQAVSILFILDTLLIALFQAPLISSLEKFNKIILVGIGSLLMGVGMITLNYPILFVIAILSCIIWTAGEMIFIPMVQFVCYEAGLEKKKGQAMGIMQSVSASSRVLGPSIGGYIYTNYSGQTVWMLSFLIGVICFLACVYFKNFDHPLNTHSYTTSNEGTVAGETSI